MMCSSPTASTIWSASGKTCNASAFDDMRLIVADTGPLNYLVLIGASDLLPKLFETVLVPQAVCDELRRHGGRWMSANARHWRWRGLNADLLLMDDRAGVAVARRHGF